MHQIKERISVILFVILLTIHPGISFSQDEGSDSEKTGDMNEKTGDMNEETGDMNEDTSSGNIPDVLVHYDSEKNSTEYAVVVEKDTQRLFLYAHDNGAFREVHRFNCSTGKKYGPKTRKGDKKTPEGVYFFIKEFEKKYLSPIYGARAFPMDYPNILDRIAKRTGNAIWLHGINKPLKPMDSNGCVELEDPSINKVAKYITLNRTPIIVTDKLSYEPSDPKVKESAFSILSDWNAALEKGTYHEYLKHYDPDYLPDISWWPEWNKIRKNLQKTGKPLSAESENVLIVRLRNVYVILFDQVIKYSGRDFHVGAKKFFLKYKENKLTVIAEEYQPAQSDKKENRFIATSRVLKTRPLIATGTGPQKNVKVDHKQIASMIDGWIRAWSSKDIEAYANYYASDFHSQGMNKKSWVRYKNQLNKKYKHINVKSDRLTVKKGKKRLIASFVQHYSSSGFKAVGIKTLILKREGGQWKIYRESWRKS